MSKRQQFIDLALYSDTTACIVWPFAVRKSSGYGAYSRVVDGRKCSSDAHRYVCILAHGAPAEAGLEAAHSCGNKLCINPKHLRWADHAANMADAKAQGTLRGGGRYRQRFFPSDIARIVSSNQSHSALAAAHNTDVAYIGRLRRKHASEFAHG